MQIAMVRPDVLLVDLVLERGYDRQVDHLRQRVVVPVTDERVLLAFLLDDARWQGGCRTPVDVEPRPAEPVHAVSGAPVLIVIGRWSTVVLVMVRVGSRSTVRQALMQVVQQRGQQIVVGADAHLVRGCFAIWYFDRVRFHVLVLANTQHLRQRAIDEQRVFLPLVRLVRTGCGRHQRTFHPAGWDVMGADG